jgi:hypothetical protein
MNSIKCPSCNKPLPGWARDSCPSCGSPIRKPKSSLTPFIAVAGILIMIIVIVALLVFMPPPAGQTQNVQAFNDPQKPPQGTGPGGAFKAMPNIPISMQKQGTDKIVVTNIGGPDTNAVSDFVVTLNGAVVPGKLGVTPGQSLIVATPTHPNTVIVTANFKDGTSFVVSNKNFE